MGRDEPDRAARQRRDDERGQVELARGGAGAVGHHVGRVALAADHTLLVPALVGRLRLGVLGDRRHHRYGLDRVGADRRLLGEHQGIGPVEDGVGHVAGLGPSRPVVGAHALQHLRRRDDGPADVVRQ